MKTFKTLAAIAAILSAAPAFAGSQLAASAGLSAAEADTLSLTEIAAAKFSRNAGHDEQISVVTPGAGGDVSQLAASAGVSEDLSLTEIAAAKFSRNAGHDEQVSAIRGAGVTAASRSAESGAWSQLAASAGLSADEAAGMSLTDIAAAKFSRNAGHDEQQAW